MSSQGGALTQLIALGDSPKHLTALKKIILPNKNFEKKDIISYYKYPYNNRKKYTECKILRFRDFLYRDTYPILQSNFCKR